MSDLLLAILFTIGALILAIIGIGILIVKRMGKGDKWYE